MNVHVSEWIDFVSTSSTSWKKFNLYWLLNFTRPLIVIRYESLLTDLRSQLRRIGEFLGYGINNERHLACVQNNSNGYFRRTGRRHKNPFTEDMETDLNRTKTEVDVAISWRDDHISIRS